MFFYQNKWQFGGFFPCSRGVRQGDPLSPLLFCLAEEVLSRGISKLVNDKKILNMASPQGYLTPSHILYADDIFVCLSIICWCSKVSICQPLADKVKLKLASWKGKSLSMMGRIQLVNTVITGFLAYSFNMYKWIISLLNQFEQWCRNFIWTSDILKKKGIVTVNWDMICSPLDNGGLKIINLQHEKMHIFLSLLGLLLIAIDIGLYS